MDPELAKRLFAEGAVLVLLDVPERTEFGIDYNCWSVGPKFKGVKMIPPGLHFIYYWYSLYTSAHPEPVANAHTGLASQWHLLHTHIATVLCDIECECIFLTQCCEQGRTGSS